MTTVALTVPAAATGGCLSIGNFDGVHLGHATMLAELRRLATELQTRAVVVTFDPHPIAVLRPEFSPPVLTTIEDRIELLKSHAADEVVVLPVTRQLLQMSAQEFFEEVVHARFSARGIVEGPNFHFGRDRQGDVGLLEQLCGATGIQCRIVNPRNIQGQMVSSSRIRELLCSRALADAVTLLGHPYRLSGSVRQGAGRGATLGFPTANLADIHTLLPAHGVYAGMTHLSDVDYPAAVSIGPNPTFGEHREKVECHIVGYSGNLYGQRLRIDLLSELRPLQSFPSPTELVRQIQTDIEACRRIAASHTSSRAGSRG